MLLLVVELCRSVKMYKWLAKANPHLEGRYEKPKLPGLPDPNSETSDCAARSFERANEAVTAELMQGGESARKKRGKYHEYDAESRAKMAKYACDNGVVKAARHFSEALGHPVNKSTIQSIQKKYKRTLQQVHASEKVLTLPKEPRGRPLLLPSDIDKVVQEHLRAMRASGGPVNRKIAIASALGITRALAPSLLLDSGGHLRLTKTWADSILRRIGYVKRKGTKAARKLPDNFDDLRSEFLQNIKRVVQEKEIPDDLVINVNETALPIIPVSDWTLEEEGATQVALTALDDKRMITAVVAVSLTGEVLPPQLLYEGTTTRCHPRGVTFPSGWDIWHSATHWSNHDTFGRYAAEVLLPWTAERKKRLQLPEDHPTLVIFDVYQAHRTPDVLDVFKRLHFEVLFVPGNCTGELQPLDLSVNCALKGTLRDKFTE